MKQRMSERLMEDMSAVEDVRDEVRPGGPVIVIARDDLRDPIATTLGAAGIPALAFVTTTEALAHLRLHAVAPPLIVLDWDAPGLSALRFVAFHASSPAHARTPIVVIAEPTTSHHIPKLCVSAILHRPVAMGRVVEMVNRFATRRTRSATANR